MPPPILSPPGIIAIPRACSTGPPERSGGWRLHDGDEARSEDGEENCLRVASVERGRAIDRVERAEDRGIVQGEGSLDRRGSERGRIMV
jgi:hypothetical protein